MVINMKQAKVMAWGVATVFLLIHVVMILMFSICGVEPMVRFNVFSIIFYLVMMWVVYKEWLNVYCPAVFFEVILHMTLAVIFTGWENQFQITVIGINILAFYGEYVGRAMKIKYVPMLPISALGMAMYLGAFLYEHAHPAQYPLPDKVTFVLTLTWGAVVFAIAILFLQIFVLIAIRSEEKLEFQMSHDKLTQLPNRYYLSHYVKRIEKEEGLKEYWVAISDVDDFKVINDTYGHNCGDYVLATIASMAKKEDDILCCRWGGEEYIFIGSMKGGIDKACQRLENFRKSVESYPFSYEGRSFNVTITLGVAAYEPGMSADEWMSRADQKLYDGKNNGKNRVVM